MSKTNVPVREESFNRSFKNEDDAAVLEAEGEATTRKNPLFLCIAEMNGDMAMRKNRPPPVLSECHQDEKGRADAKPAPFIAGGDFRLRKETSSVFCRSGTKKDCEMFRKIIIYSLVKIFLRSAIR